MRVIVLILSVTAALTTGSRDASAQDAVPLISFHFASMRGSPTGGVTMRNVRAVVGAIQVEAEEAELSVADGRLRLVLKGGGIVTLPQRSRVEVVTGPYDRLQRDEGLTRSLQAILLRHPRLPRQPPEFILPLG